MPAMPAAPAGRGRSLAAAVARILVSGALVAWVLSKSDLGQVGASFRSARLGYLAAALGLWPVGWTLSVLRWRLLLRVQGGDASFGFLLRSFLVGVFFNNLLPSTIGGDAMRAYDTARTGVGRGRAVAIIFVDRFLGLAALMLFAAVALAVPGALAGRVPGRIPGLLPWVALGLALMLLAVWGLFVPSRGVERLLGRLRALCPERARSLFDKGTGSLLAFRDVRGIGGVLARGFALSALLQAVVVLNAWLLAAAVGVCFPLAVILLYVPIAHLVLMLPVSINGIGVREGIWALLFTGFGAAPESAVAFAWLDYGLLLGQAVLGGIVYAAARRQPQGPGWSADGETEGPRDEARRGERGGPVIRLGSRRARAVPGASGVSDRPGRPTGPGEGGAARVIPFPQGPHAPHRAAGSPSRSQG